MLGIGSILSMSRHTQKLCLTVQWVYWRNTNALMQRKGVGRTDIPLCTQSGFFALFWDITGLSSLMVMFPTILDVILSSIYLYQSIYYQMKFLSSLLKKKKKTLIPKRPHVKIQSLGAEFQNFDLCFGYLFLKDMEILF